MGVRSLKSFIHTNYPAIVKQGNLKDLDGKTIAIDAPCIIHMVRSKWLSKRYDAKSSIISITTAVVNDITNNDIVNSWRTYMNTELNKFFSGLKTINCNVILVSEGGAPDIKRQSLSRRHVYRVSVRSRATRMLDILKSYVDTGTVNPEHRHEWHSIKQKILNSTNTIDTDCKTCDTRNNIDVIDVDDRKKSCHCRITSPIEKHSYEKYICTNCVKGISNFDHLYKENKDLNCVDVVSEQQIPYRKLNEEGEIFAKTQDLLRSSSGDINPLDESEWIEVRSKRKKKEKYRNKNDSSQNSLEKNINDDRASFTNKCNTILRFTMDKYHSTMLPNSVDYKQMCKIAQQHDAINLTAKYEAETTCAALVEKGYATYVMSSDTDSIVYRGGERIIYEISLKNSAYYYYDREQFMIDMDAKCEDEFICSLICCGTDYNSPIKPGTTPLSALQHLRCMANSSELDFLSSFQNSFRHLLDVYYVYTFQIDRGMPIKDEFDMVYVSRSENYNVVKNFFASANVSHKDKTDH